MTTTTTKLQLSPRQMYWQTSLCLLVYALAFPVLHIIVSIHIDDVNWLDLYQLPWSLKPKEIWYNCMHPVNSPSSNQIRLNGFNLLHLLLNDSFLPVHLLNLQEQTALQDQTNLVFNLTNCSLFSRPSSKSTTFRTHWYIQLCSLLCKSFRCDIGVKTKL